MTRGSIDIADDYIGINKQAVSYMLKSGERSEPFTYIFH